jgi:hypothetical protein
MLTRLVILMIAAPLGVLHTSLDQILYHGVLENNQQYLTLVLKLSTRPWLMQLQKSFRLRVFLVNSIFLSLGYPVYGVII